MKTVASYDKNGSNPKIKYELTFIPKTKPPLQSSFQFDVLFYGL